MLAIYDVSGRLVRLEDEPDDLGEHEALWDRTTEAGSPAALGRYLIRLGAHGTSLTRELVPLH